MGFVALRNPAVDLFDLPVNGVRLLYGACRARHVIQVREATLLVEFSTVAVQQRKRHIGSGEGTAFLPGKIKAVNMRLLRGAVPGQTVMGPAPRAEHVQHVAVVLVHVHQRNRTPVGAHPLIGAGRIQLDGAQRGFDGEVLDLPARTVCRPRIPHQQRVVTDRVGRPRVPFRPGPGIFRISEIRNHRHVFRQQPQVEGIVVRVTLSLPVVDEHRATVFRTSGLQLRLPVPAEVLARQVAPPLLSGFFYLSDQCVGILPENIVFQTQCGPVIGVLLPRQRRETRVPVQPVRPGIGRGIALTTPCTHGAAVARIGHHPVQHVQP